jgi:pyruvate dehydrogenase E2 component (dihydrolipoamide acetyltransferase)
MEEGTFLEWLKKSGDIVKEGEPLFTLESDKAAQEVESTDSGILHVPADGPKAGAVVKVGAVLGYLLQKGEAAPLEASVSEAEKSPIQKALPPEVRTNATTPAVTQISTNALGKTKSDAPASPRARRAAAENSVDLSTVTPTGSTGRIRERDVLATARPREQGGVKWRDVPINAMRRIIAERLELSLRQTVPVTITCRCDATGMVSLRKQLKAAEVTPLPSFNDIILKITAGTLNAHPNLTGRWAGTHIQIPDSIDIGFAVETDEGLVVPVLRKPGSLQLSEIARRSKSLIELARSRRLTASEMRDGCFTVSNLGAFGVDAFTPVIQFPETAILGVGSIAREAVSLPDGTLVSREQLNLSLTFDHRAIDGAPAARFLQTLRTRLESPTAWLLRE